MLFIKLLLAYHQLSVFCYDCTRESIITCKCFRGIHLIWLKLSSIVNHRNHYRSLLSTYSENLTHFIVIVIFIGQWKSLTHIYILYKCNNKNGNLFVLCEILCTWKNCLHTHTQFSSAYRKNHRYKVFRKNEIFFLFFYFFLFANN